MPLIPIYYGFQVNDREPIDARHTFANATARLALSTYIAYEGLITYQEDTNEVWALTDASDPSDASNWKRVDETRDFGSGSGDIATWAEGNNTDTIPAAKIPATTISLSDLAGASDDGAILRYNATSTNWEVASNIDVASDGDITISKASESTIDFFASSTGEAADIGSIRFRADDPSDNAQNYVELRGGIEDLSEHDARFNIFLKSANYVSDTNTGIVDAFEINASNQTGDNFINLKGNTQVDTRLTIGTGTTRIHIEDGASAPTAGQALVWNTTADAFIPETIAGDVVANPTGTDGGNLTRITIAGTNYNIAGSGGGTGNVSIIVLTATGQAVGSHELAYVSATEIYQNISGAEITGVVLTTDFSDTDDWLRIGGSTDGGRSDAVSITVLTATGQDIINHGLAYVSATEIYQNISGATVTGVVLTTDFSDTDDWLRIGEANRATDGLTVIQIDTTNRTVEPREMAWLSNKEAYINVSSTDITNVTTSTNFNNTNWVRLGVTTNGVSHVNLDTTNRTIAQGYIARVNDNEAYVNISGTAQTNVTTSTSFTNRTNWLPVVRPEYNLTRNNIQVRSGELKSLITNMRYNTSTSSAPSAAGEYRFLTTVTGDTVIGNTGGLNTIRRIQIYREDSNGNNWEAMFADHPEAGSSVRIFNGDANDAQWSINSATYDTDGHYLTFNVEVANIYNHTGSWTTGSEWNITMAPSNQLLIAGRYLIDGTVTNAKLADDAVGVDELNAEGQAAGRRLSLQNDGTTMEWVDEDFHRFYEEDTFTDSALDSDGHVGNAQVWLSPNTSGVASTDRLATNARLTTVRRIFVSTTGTTHSDAGEFGNFLSQLTTGSLVRITSEGSGRFEHAVWRLAATPTLDADGFYTIALPLTAVDSGHASTGYAQGDTIRVEIRPQNQIMITNGDLLDNSVNSDALQANSVGSRALNGVGTTEQGWIIATGNENLDVATWPTQAASTIESYVIQSQTDADSNRTITAIAAPPRVAANPTGSGFTDLTSITIGAVNYNISGSGSGTLTTRIVPSVAGTTVDVSPGEIAWVSASEWYINIDSAGTDAITVSSTYDFSSATNAPHWRRYSAGASVQLQQDGVNVGTGATTVNFTGGDAIRVTPSPDDTSLNVVTVNAIPVNQRETYQIAIGGSRTNAIASSGNTIYRVYLPNEIVTPGTSSDTTSITFDPNTLTTGSSPYQSFGNSTLSVDGSETNEDDYARDIAGAILGAYSESPEWSFNGTVDTTQNSSLTATTHGDEFWLTFHHPTPNGDTIVNTNGTYSGSGNLTLDSNTGFSSSGGTCYIQLNDGSWGEFSYSGTSGTTQLTFSAGNNPPALNDNRPVHSSNNDYKAPSGGDSSDIRITCVGNTAAVESGIDVPLNGVVFGVGGGSSNNRANFVQGDFAGNRYTSVNGSGFQTFEALGNYTDSGGTDRTGFVQWLRDNINARLSSATYASGIGRYITSISVETGAAYRQGIPSFLNPHTIRIVWATDQGVITGPPVFTFGDISVRYSVQQRIPGLVFGSKLNPERIAVDPVDLGPNATERRDPGNGLYYRFANLGLGTPSWPTQSVVMGWELRETSTYSNNYWWSGYYNTRFIDIDLGQEIAAANYPQARLRLTNQNYESSQAYEGNNLTSDFFDSTNNGGKHAGFFLIDTATPDATNVNTTISIIDQNGVERATTGGTPASITPIRSTESNRNTVMTNIVTSINASTSTHGFEAIYSEADRLFTVRQTLANAGFENDDWSFSINNGTAAQQLALGTAVGSLVFNNPTGATSFKAFEGYSNYVFPNTIRTFTPTEQAELNTSVLTDLQVFGEIYTIPEGLPPTPQKPLTTIPSTAAANGATPQAQRFEGNNFTSAGFLAGQWALSNINGTLTSADVALARVQAWSGYMVSDAQLIINMPTAVSASAVATYMNDLNREFKYLVGWRNASNWAVWEMDQDLDYWVHHTGTNIIYQHYERFPRLITFEGDAGTNEVTDNIRWIFSTDNTGTNYVRITQDLDQEDLLNYFVVGDGNWRYINLPDGSNICTLNGVQTITGNKTFSGVTTFTGNTTIGDANTDTLTVPATTTFSNNVTLGSSTADTITIEGTISADGIDMGDHRITDQWVSEVSDLLSPGLYDLVDPFPPTGSLLAIHTNLTTYDATITAAHDVNDNGWGFFPALSAIPGSWQDFIGEGHFLVMDQIGNTAVTTLVNFFDNTNNASRVFVAYVSDSQYAIFEHFGNRAEGEADGFSIDMDPAHTRLLGAAGGAPVAATNVRWYYSVTGAGVYVPLAQLVADLVLTDDGYRHLPSKEEIIVPVRNSTDGSLRLSVANTTDLRFFRGFVRTDRYTDSNVYVIRRNIVDADAGTTTTTWRTWPRHATGANAGQLIDYTGDAGYTAVNALTGWTTNIPTA